MKVRVHAASLNPLDWKIRAGHLRWLPVFRRPPRTLGCDFAGEIVGVGAGARSHYVGERVFGSLLPFGRDGALAEYLVAGVDRLATMPDDLGFDQAAALPIAAGTALQAVVDEARLGAGQRILITGAAGGVGHFAVQIAKHVGAHVVAVCGAANADFVRGLGADEVVDYARDDFTRRADRFDVVFDAACASSFTAARAVLTDAGCYLNTGGDAAAAVGHRGGRAPRAGRLPPARGPDRARQRVRALGAARGARAGGRAARRTSSARSRSRTSRTRSARWQRATGAARSSCGFRRRRDPGCTFCGPGHFRSAFLSAGDDRRKPRRSRTKDAGTVNASAASMPSAFGTASRSTTT